MPTELTPSLEWPSTLASSPLTASRSFFDRLGLGRRELRAWALYDSAHSAFWTTVIVAVFPPFFSDYAAAGSGDLATVSARFAWATTIAVAIAALLGPVCGAIADYRARKKLLLTLSMLVGVTATVLMATIERGDWVYAAVLFGIG